MSNMQISADSLRDLPVFPLASTVFFPGTVLPLHLVEPQHIEMIQDAMGSHQCVAVALKRQRQGRAGQDIHRIACVGKIIHAEKSNENALDVLVEGIGRVKLVQKLPQQSSYLRFRAVLIPQPSPRMLAGASSELAKLQSCVVELGHLYARTDAQLMEVLRASHDPLGMADILAATLVADPLQQQKILGAKDVKTRLRHLVDTLAEVLVQSPTIGNERLN